MMAVSIAVGANGQTVEPGKPEALFTTRFATGANVLGSASALSKPQYAVAPVEPLRFLMNVAVEETSVPPITVVLNWDSEIQK